MPENVAKKPSVVSGWLVMLSQAVVGGLFVAAGPDQLKGLFPAGLAHLAGWTTAAAVVVYLVGLLLSLITGGWVRRLGPVALLTSLIGGAIFVGLAWAVPKYAPGLLDYIPKRWSNRDPLLFTLLGTVLGYAAANDSSPKA